MKRTAMPMRILLPLVGLLLSLFTVMAYGQDQAKGLTLAPGVLVDPANGVAYMMTPRREIDAVRLADGEVLWSSAAATKPVAVSENRLLAQVENVEPSSVLTLAMLDLTSGARLGSDSTDLGPDVITSVDAGKEHLFVIGAGATDTSTGPILWRYFEQKLRGPEDPPPTVIERFGAFDVSESATMSSIAGGGSSRQTGLPPYALPRILRPVSERPAADSIILDLESGLRYRLDGVQVPSEGGTAAPSVSATDSRVAAIVARPPTSGLFLTEGREGEEFPPTRRIPGDQFATSVDDRHIAASTFAGRIEAAEPYRWTVYERGSFEVVASYVARTSLAPFIVADGHVLYLRQPFEQREGGTLQSYPPALVARDLETGRIAWTRAVRDTRYLGPIPEQAK